MRIGLWVVVVGLLGVNTVALAEDGSYTIRKRPFSVAGDEYDVQEHGRNVGTIREQPFALTSTYEVRDTSGRTTGTYRKKPFSLTEEWEFTPQ